MLRGSSVLDRYAFDDRLGYGWTQYTALAAGTYTIQAIATWTSYDVRDYVVSVYSADALMIYDSAGKTSFDPVASLTDTLKADLTTAMRNLTPYATEAGGWYTIRSGNYQPT